MTNRTILTLGILLLAICSIKCSSKKQKSYSEIPLMELQTYLCIDSLCQNENNLDTLEKRCSKVELNYFNSSTSLLNDSLLDFYQALIGAQYQVGMIDIKEGMLDASILCLSLFSDWHNVRHEFSGYAVPWEIKLNSRLLYQDREITSVFANTYSYTGGAHGLPLITNANFYNASGQRIFLNDVITDQDEFKILLLAQLKQQYEIPFEESLLQHGFYVSDEDFPISDNFGFSTDGIRIVYNPYEIAPYAKGFFIVDISYNKLKELDLLKISINPNDRNGNI